MMYHAGHEVRIMVFIKDYLPLSYHSFSQAMYKSCK